MTIQMTIIEQINLGIKESMLSKNQIRLDTLRMLKSKILAVDARALLPDAEVLKLFKTYYGNIKEAQEQAIQLNRLESADKLSKELEIVQEFLPKALSEDETRALIIQAIAETGAKTKKDFGLVMKSLMKLGKPVDGKLVKELADHLLTN